MNRFQKVNEELFIVNTDSRFDNLVEEKVIQIMNIISADNNKYLTLEVGDITEEIVARIIADEYLKEHQVESSLNFISIKYTFRNKELRISIGKILVDENKIKYVVGLVNE